jgi:hypothetical protein
MSAEVHIFRPRDLLRTMKRVFQQFLKGPLFDSMRDKKSKSRKTGRKRDFDSVERIPRPTER